MGCIMHVYSVASKRGKKKYRGRSCYGAEIFESGLAVRPTNPFFVCRSTNVQRRILYIPNKVIKDHHLKLPKNLFLVDERGRYWETKIKAWRNGQQLCCSEGWKRLYKANHIDIGDICICEFVQEGCSDLYILVNVIKARTFTRKEGIEEEEVEQVDEESTYTNDHDENDGYDSDENDGYDYDENDGYESGMQMNISKAKHNLKSSSSRAPIRRSARKENTFGGNKSVEEDKIEKVDKDTFYFNLPNNNHYDENDGDEIRMQINISKAKHKLKSSSPCAPVRRSVRKDNTFGGKKGFEDDGIEKIDIETYFHLSKEMSWNVQQRKIENQDAYIKKLKGVIKNLIGKDVSQKRNRLVKSPCHQDEDKSSDNDIELIETPISLQGTLVGSSVMMTICLPEKLELLQSYFKLVHDKDSVSISVDDDVFGKKYMIYIFLEDINNFCLLEPISDGCIVAYMWYLYRKMKKENIPDRFRFVNPAFISYLSTRTTDQRARALVDRLIGASTNQLVLVPCNVGFHWILTVIYPYSKTVLLLDPLSHRNRDEAWQDVVNTALLMFSAAKGEKGKKSPVWVVIKAPLQPDFKQCGFYIMRYMREIIEAYRDLDLILLQSVFTKDGYSINKIDEVRTEWAECILDYMG